jgi:hypothetical protein
MNIGLVLTPSAIMILIITGTGLGSSARMEVSNTAKSSICLHGLVLTDGNINRISYGLDINDFISQFIAKAAKNSINITKSTGSVLSITTIGPKFSTNEHLVHQIVSGIN